MRRQWFIAVLLVLAFSFISLNSVSSQSGQSGMITGTVKDPNGAVVAGARVTVRSDATGETRDAVTDNQGRFKVEGLASGGYKITINRDGFKTVERAVSIETGKTATTETFKAIVEKHMTPQMDLDGNKRMDWFFGQWVYGTEVPRYKFEYSLTPDSDGKVTLRGAVTQSDVSPNFKMPVPIYLDFGGKIVRLGAATVMGNMTTKEFEVKLPEKPKRAMINYHYDVLAYESVSVGK